MINKNSGSILVVTVVTMFILTIIGFVCMQMFVAQNIMVFTDVAKVRTFYAADGVVEMMRGYINRFYPDDEGNLLDSGVSTDPWTEASVINATMEAGYDTTLEYPVVCARVELRRAPIGATPLYVDFSTTTPAVQYYRIMGVSSVTINSDVIYSTVSYYFYVSSMTPPGNIWRKHFAGWREHKIIQNDTGLIQ